jgi:hypothetical protein
MSFTDYSELQASVAAFLTRNDLGSEIPDFITLAEARIGRKLALLDWEEQVVLATVDSVITLPIDYKAMRNVMNDGFPLVFMTPSQFSAEIRPGATVPPTSASQNPYAYTILGSNKLQVGTAVADGSEFTVEYIARLVPLSSTNPTNWILTHHPDLLLCGSMEAACAFIKNEKDEIKWAQKFGAYILELRKEDDLSRGGGAPLQIRSGY